MKLLLALARLAMGLWAGAVAAVALAVAPSVFGFLADRQQAGELMAPIFRKVDLFGIGAAVLFATATRQMVVEIRKRADGIHSQVRDQSCFTGIHFRDEHPLVSMGAGSGCHRQDSACVADHAVQRKLADDEGVIDNIVRKMTCQHDDTQRNRQVVGRSFFADGGGRQVDDNAMTGKMQARVLHGGLYTLAAFLHRSIGQAVGEIHFHFNDNAFKPNDSTGKYSGEHGESLDDEARKVKHQRVRTGVVGGTVTTSVV